MNGINKRWLNGLLPLILLFSVSIMTTAHAESSSDPLADITELYAFMSPPCTVRGGTGCEAPPEELILAWTVAPSATEASRFSDAVVYHIYFENDVGTDSQIDCSVSSAQIITCAGLDGLSVSAAVGEIGVNGDIRVFAGLRDDPRYFDRVALERFATMGVLAFKEPGVDTVAGSNTLAIVVGIKNNSFPAGSGAKDSNGHSMNIQKTWVASERTKPGINAGIAGSWYNPEQDGQGWVIEKISTGQFLFYFYGYDDAGERLWLLGISNHSGDSNITVDVLRFSGTGFGANFDPASKSSESVGSMTFDFADCNSATVDFTPSSDDLSPFSIPVVRLTGIATVDCMYSGTGQVDRTGRPGASLLLPEEKRAAYNAASDPGTWVSLYTADMEAGLTATDSADGINGNSFNPPSELAPLMADDRLKVDLEWSACLGVWGLELSVLVPQPHPNDCGGRMLDYDYIEEFLSMTISGFDPLYDDFVTANDVPFLAEFPFLAAPH